MVPPTDTLRSPDGAPSSEERLLAGAAHLGFLGGFWLIAPMVILLLKRKDSPFVAFHALQAVLLALAVIPVAIGAWLFAIVAQIAGVVWLGDIRASYLFVFLFFGAAFVPSLLMLAIAVVAGVRALRGETWSIPLVGRLARSVLADEQLRSMPIDAAARARAGAARPG